MNVNIQNLSHYGDILAIPFFFILSVYFYNIEKKTLLENILFLFSLSGFVLDILFTVIYIKKRMNLNRLFLIFYIFKYAWKYIRKYIRK